MEGRPELLQVTRTAENTFFKMFLIKPKWKLFYGSLCELNKQEHPPLFAKCHAYQ